MVHTCCGLQAGAFSFGLSEVSEEPPALKTGVLTKPNDSTAKGASHRKHYKLSPRSDCDKWGLCAVCQKSGDITCISRVDGSQVNYKSFFRQFSGRTQANPAQQTLRFREETRAH